LKYHCLWDYYVVNHVLGGEKKVRELEFTKATVVDFFLFYPRSVFRNHAGPTFFKFAPALLILVFLFGRPLAKRAKAWREITSSGTAAAYCFTFVLLIVPLSILTAMVVKSPIVGNILVPPLFWLILLPITQLAGPQINVSSKGISRLLAGLALVAVLW